MANKLSRYSNLFMNASLYMYSTPKYKAKTVKPSTNIEDIRAKASIQNNKFESIKSIQKNHLPKSTKK